MTIMVDEIRLSTMVERANGVWRKYPCDQSKLSEMLGSSKRDSLGEKYWAFIKCGCFIAPNFYLNKDDPTLVKALNCVEVGEDRDDRPLYYFLDNGRYAVSSDNGLMFVASSTAEFFDAFITYAEWVDEVIVSNGSSALIESQFSQDDLARLLSRYTRS